MDNELYHYGVLGMKWGVRRFQNSDGSLTSAGKKRYNTNSHPDSQRVHDGKKASEMSDAELRDRLNRINMEQQYSRLTYADTHRGQAAAQKALKALGTVAVTTTTLLTLYNNVDKMMKIAKPAAAG